MHWNASRPDIGDTRKRHAFLWLPKTINGETRWLEWARWEECYGCRLPFDHPDCTDQHERMMKRSPLASRWHAFRWLPLDPRKIDPPYKPPDSLDDMKTGGLVPENKIRII